MRIGIIADTHMPGSLRTMWDEVHSAFEGVELVLHAGDIMSAGVLDQLEAIAPVLAARGNNDHGWQDPRVADAQWLDVHGYRVAMVHDMEPEDEPLDHLRTRFLKGEAADVIITGHTHQERIDWRDGVLQVNPGSAVHPHLWSTRLGTVALLDIEPGVLRARIVVLGETEGLRNPGVAYTFDGAAVHAPS